MGPDSCFVPSRRPPSRAAPEADSHGKNGIKQEAASMNTDCQINKHGYLSCFWGNFRVLGSWLKERDWHRKRELAENAGEKGKIGRARHGGNGLQNFHSIYLVCRYRTSVHFGYKAMYRLYGHVSSDKQWGCIRHLLHHCVLVMNPLPVPR